MSALQPLQGPNIAGVDPESGQLVHLFHPRNDRWIEHFEFEGGRIVGKTPVGRATIQVLDMNAKEPLLFRLELLHAGTILS